MEELESAVRKRETTREKLEVPSVRRHCFVNAGAVQFTCSESENDDTVETLK
jgi:hypothetical protein